MGFLYRQRHTKPIPAGAAIIVRKGERFAQWTDSKGKTRTAPLTEDGARIAGESRTYMARYRDGEGIVRDVPTGCKDRGAAQAVLTELETTSENVKAGVLTVEDLNLVALADAPLADLRELYELHLTGAGVSVTYRKNVLAAVKRVFADCQFVKVADLNRGDVETWLAARLAEDMSARSRNAYLMAVSAFCNWAVNTSPPLMRTNPFAGIGKANEKADPRRRRRSMTEDELTRLLAAAASRPLADARTVRRGGRRGEQTADLKPDTVARLELLGRERALIYKALVLTGLRKGELTTLTVGRLELDSLPARLHLEAANEKNREGNTLPIREDLAVDLAAWIADTGRKPADLLFTVPRDLRKILDRDLKAVGIAKRDDRGRTLDVHALRTTFGTLLSVGGTSPRTAQAAMRHSDLKLTMGVYTDPRLLDVSGALSSLPALPLGVPNGRLHSNSDPSEVGIEANPLSGNPIPSKSTRAPSTLLSTPAPVKTGHFGAFTDHGQANVLASETGEATERKSLAGNEKGPLSTGDNEPLRIGPAGFEPTTSCTPICATPLETPEKQGDSDASAVRLHSRLHSFPNDAHGIPPSLPPSAILETLGLLLSRLSADERAALAGMLTGSEEGRPTDANDLEGEPQAVGAGIGRQTRT